MSTLTSEKHLRGELWELISKRQEPLAPLPSTRKLADMLDVSHVTVAKTLLAMSERGELFKGANGRYFSDRRGLVSEEPKPVTCFIRSINAWAGWYPELMAGIGRGCEESGCGLLIHPVSQLLEQDAPDARPRIPADTVQRELLQALLSRTQAEGRRLILDDLWSESVLVDFADELAGARILLRPSQVPDLVSVSPNFNQGALLAVTHLLSRGYEKIWVIRPFGGVATVDAMVSAFENVFHHVGADANRFEIVDNAMHEGIDVLVERLTQQAARVGVYCAEENFALSLYEGLKRAGTTIPDSIGLVAGWGAGPVAERGLSSLQLDLRKLGAMAVGDEIPDQALDFSLRCGGST